MSFGPESTTDDVLAGVDLSGRRFVVTGASSGLGEETTRAVAERGAAVTMAVRDLERGADRNDARQPRLASNALRELGRRFLGVRRRCDDLHSPGCSTRSRLAHPRFPAGA